MPLSHAILAFLEYHPMSGYDLKKIFDASVSHFWSASQSHIYKALDELQGNGWVEVTVIPQDGKPSRKEYSITEPGRLELHKWLTAPLPLHPVRQDWLIQLFFSAGSSNEQIANILQARITEMHQRQEIYRTVAKAAIDEYAQKAQNDRTQQLWQMTLDYGIDGYDFEIAWLEKKLTAVQNLPPLPPPEH
jgi:DNA-binding PadR family transcriptional regulator